MNIPDSSVGGWPTLSEMRDAASDYRRLLNALRSRAHRMGSRDPESAAQETLMRSLERELSRPAVEYYFSDELPSDAAPPAWPLDQLMAWLHGVLYFVVLEERNRGGNRRVLDIRRAPGADALDFLEPADPAPDQLDALIQKELQEIVIDCLPALDADYRRVLKMRASGLKYGDIAELLGVNKNTVASWVSRGIRTLAHCVRRRTQPRINLATMPEGTKVNHEAGS